MGEVCFSPGFKHEKRIREGMLETVVVILLVLWLLGLIAGQTFGGLLHALLLIALVIFLIRLFTGRRGV
jgi:cation transporter-like permease